MSLALELNSAIQDVANRLFAARAGRLAIPAVRNALPEKDIAAAYAVQLVNVRRTLAQGAQIVGRKIGLTSQAVQKQLGVDQPDFGVLFDFMDFGGMGAEISASQLIAPRIEAEFAFKLGADISERPASAAEVGRAVEAVAVAAEIVDSAIAGWDINIVDTVADNASCGGFVAGPWIPFTPELDLPSRTMRMIRDGAEISTGRGAATLGDPLNALAWLARTAIDFGEPLKAGEIVLAGALGPMVPLAPGDYVVEIDGFKPLWLRAKP
ncbi:2-keto-4-pentenoate hydratase [Phenylobacterium montanum]|uniref:Fumarylacetoacetate hydrolase family protein n=1 Tax=Phenylobacterium montanum TaxID=2823693 RepID=A0A975IWR4_9CAUL|nr:fumarylacetoacetate hydrolase family protein [Caulobacter sp. S6]QUD90347.1 fumarylacetoacetate hydrolase family protein [Caulobacter sp. S6]